MKLAVVGGGSIIIGLLAIYTTKVDFDNPVSILLWLLVLAIAVVGAAMLGMTVFVMGVGG